MECENTNVDRLFRSIQRFLETTPLLVWGSGATVPCGMPTMSQLARYIKANGVSELDESKNFEDELCDPKYDSYLPKIRQLIWDRVSAADLDFKSRITSGARDNYIEAIRCMVEKFRDAHPRKFEILTTNYDRVLEYVVAYYGLPFSDGTAFAELSEFDADRFKSVDCVNILKVHGSLSWFDVRGDVRCMNRPVDGVLPMIIIPGKGKYREANKIPYRDLIHRADRVIGDATAFLAVGFGFNDEHITPELIKKVNKGVPIVVVTKNVSEQCRESLRLARRSLLIEEDTKHNGCALVTISEGKPDAAISYSVPGEYWRLPMFMEALS